MPGRITAPVGYSVSKAEDSREKRGRERLSAEFVGLLFQVPYFPRQPRHQTGAFTWPGWSKGPQGPFGY
jgi:hypothetical protein